MTSLPPNADELVSAYLDGEAAPDEIAIVESNAELMARVESLRVLSEMLAQPVNPPAPEQREVHIGAALELFDELFSSAGTGGDTEAAPPPPAAVPTPPPASGAPLTNEPTTPPTASASGAHDSIVTSFEDARARRRPRRTGLIAAAAAALLLFVGITALSVGRSNDSSEVADTATDSIEAAADDSTDDDEDSTGAVEAAELNPEPSNAGAGASAALPPEADAARSGDDADEADTETDDEGGTGATDGDTVAADDSAADDEAMDDAESAPGVEALAPQATPSAERATLFLGDFDTDAQLEQILRTLTDDDIETRRDLSTFADLFPSCQADIDDLVADESTLVAEAIVGERSVEIHVVPDLDGEPTLLVVESAGCIVRSTVAPES